jgi:hypothetical protein
LIPALKFPPIIARRDVAQTRLEIALHRAASSERRDTRPRKRYYTCLSAIYYNFLNRFFHFQEETVRAPDRIFT